MASPSAKPSPLSVATIRSVGESKKGLWVSDTFSKPGQKDVGKDGGQKDMLQKDMGLDFENTKKSTARARAMARDTEEHRKLP